jgi:uncharacterized small protein (DUF1192 family)
LPAENGPPDNLATSITEVSERMTLLVREEIELAKAEVTVKVRSLARGTVAVAAGAVFGVFGLIFVLLTLAWALNSAFGSLWEGFAVVMVLLLLAAAGAFLFAWRKFQVGPPTPTMAIDEATRIRATMGVKPERDL